MTALVRWGEKKQSTAWMQVASLTLDYEWKMTMLVLPSCTLTLTLTLTRHTILSSCNTRAKDGEAMVHAVSSLLSLVPPQSLLLLLYTLTHMSCSHLACSHILHDHPFAIIPTLIL
jgi:hypothetical protein